MNLTPELELYTKAWKNNDAYNNDFHAALTRALYELPENIGLRYHREWVKTNQYGFGDDCFHVVWRMIVEAMPAEFSFLEIGVFKGQTTSLVALAAKHIGKKANVYGVTTLENTPDERCKYPEGNYREWIKQIHDHFEVPQPNLIVGRSNDQHVLYQVGAMDFDCVYVDGGHDFGIALQDLDNYSKRVRVGGFLVVDDASIGRLNVGSCWSGLEDVARAVKERIDPDPKFKFLFAVGHLNLYQRICD